MSKQLTINLPDISLFLTLEEVLTVVAYVCKDWKQSLLTQNFFSFYIKNFFNIKKAFSFSQLKTIYLNHKSNSVLDFEGWKTDGGVSENQINSSYSNLWSYNPTIYSTYHSLNNPSPLQRNINCFASFKGGYQKKENFFHSFNNDLFSLSLGPLALDDKYNLENYIIHKCLTVDPLRLDKFEDVSIFEFDDEVKIFNEFSLTNEIFFEVHQAPAPSLVSKIAVARPFNFNGAVRCFMVFVSDSWRELDFEEFKQFDGVLDVGHARCVGKVLKEVSDEEFNVVEFERDFGVYPLVWVEFKSVGCNHLEYRLSQAHSVCAVNVKLYDVEDRSDWRLASCQQNFDVMYVVMIGTDLAMI
jgi:hypothetical protein